MSEYETREFDVELLNELDVACGGECVVRDEIVDHTRWAVIHEVVFRFERAFYMVTYSDPATEHQEVETWGYGSSVEAARVKPVEVTKVEYHLVQKKT